GWAMKILGNCTDNVITYNNFTGNTFDLMTNSTSNSNKFAFNFWDKYQGYDLDRNYIGDIPFRPVSAFGKLTETTPSAVILLRSFMVELFDKIERILPSLHSTSITDDKPLMQPFKGIIK
ncbi:MAG: nitrous oxide reductase family maturation protein NosD, partial [Bacteroidia bacterium]